MNKKRDICKTCHFWDRNEKNKKLVSVGKDVDRLLFRPCLNPVIDGVQKNQHDSNTMVIAMSKAKNPLYTHAKFGCRFYQQLEGD